MATVVADEPLRTLALQREAFLVAVMSNSMSSVAAHALADQRLTANSLAAGQVAAIVRQPPLRLDLEECSDGLVQATVGVAGSPAVTQGGDR